MIRLLTAMIDRSLCMVLISSSPQNFPYAFKQFHWNISLTFKRNESILTTLQKGYQSQKITKQVTNYVSYICCRSFAGDRKSNCLFFLNCTENLYWCKKKITICGKGRFWIGQIRPAYRVLVTTRYIIHTVMLKNTPNNSGGQEIRHKKKHFACFEE